MILRSDFIVLHSVLSEWISEKEISRLFKMYIAEVVTKLQRIFTASPDLVTGLLLSFIPHSSSSIEMDIK